MSTGAADHVRARLIAHVHSQAQQSLFHDQPQHGISQNADRTSDTVHATVPETSRLSAHPPVARLLPKDAAADRIQSNVAAAAAVVNKLPSVRGHARFRVSLIRKPTHDGQPLSPFFTDTTCSIGKKFRTSSAAAHRCCGLPGCR